MQPNLGLAEWTSMVSEANKLSGVIRTIFDDIRRKYFANVKYEFMVCLNFQCNLLWLSQSVVSPSIVPFSQLKDERRLHEIFSAEYNTCISNLMVYNLTCKKVNKSLCTWKYTFHSGCKSALAFTLSAVRSPKLNIVFN